MRLKPRFALPALVLMAAVSLALVTACETEEVLTFINESDRAVGIYFSDRLEPLETTVAPHSSSSGGMISDLWEDVIVVGDEEGNVLYREEITWDELKAQDFVFVIRPEDIESE